MSVNWAPFRQSPSQTTSLPKPTSRRYVLYDRDQVWGKESSTRFFLDNHHTSDGRQKDRSFTNMLQAGCLGYPLTFEVAFLSIYPVDAGDDRYLERYERFSKSYSIYKFLLGQMEEFVSIPIALMNVRSVEERIYRDRVTNEMCYVSVEDGKLVVNKYKFLAEAPLEGLFADKGAPRFVSTLTPDKRPRYLESTKMFCAEISGEKPEGAEPLDIYLCIEGMLHFGDP